MPKGRTSTAESMVKQLEMLKDERAILNTLHRYPHCIDYDAAEQEFLDLFTADGVFDIRGQYARARKYQGREELTQFITQHRKDATYHQHSLVNPVISINGAEAYVESYWATLDRGESGPSLGGCGRYRDRLVKKDGRWRFKERIVEIEVLNAESNR